MAPHHLLVDGGDYVIDVEFTAFRSDAREECDLKEQIAKFFAQRFGPSFARFFQRIEGFVGLFQKHRRQRGIGLLAVPGTAVGRAQARHQCYEVIKSYRHGLLELGCEFRVSGFEVQVPVRTACASGRLKLRCRLA